MDRFDSITLRKNMISLLEQMGIKDKLVLDAMGKVERHLFVSAGGRFKSLNDPYGDYPLPIGFGQTISQPFIVAYMLEKLELAAGEKVLEIGAGSGYVAAVLDEMGVEVFTVELIEQLAVEAGKLLGESVHIRTGDGYAGWPEHAPFDAIVVSCAPESIPEALIQQLTGNGRMILPVGTIHQRLVRVVRKGGEIELHSDLAVRFVPMVHQEGY
ncbi:MAG: protein-L-isoaspartate(D-aspartate) O-methyltransferase [Candidatus Fermentibacteraceae bacterium]|nr:protein-L-isoaspartate(D-aspartate) O-methyltransferase [Candidatus Fermentibacteraceae bacterium]